MVEYTCGFCGKLVDAMWKWHTTIKFGGKGHGVFHKHICKECICEKFGVSKETLHFYEFLCEFMASNKLRDDRAWSIKTVAKLLTAMKHNKISFLDYDIPLWTIGYNYQNKAVYLRDVLPGKVKPDQEQIAREEEIDEAIMKELVDNKKKRNNVLYGDDK